VLGIGSMALDIALMVGAIDSVVLDIDPMA
jgi:hypothetical protein